MPDIKEKLVELIVCPCESEVREGAFACPSRKDGECAKVTRLPYCVITKMVDHLIANGVTIQRWISVEERLPEPETEVLIFASRSGYPIITTGSYEDGTITTEDSSWVWYDHDFEYDEERDTFIISEGWWEYKHYNGDDEHNHLIDDVVTHWMPLPEPPT